ncbi:MAG: hypothetical protein PUF59_10200 [Lachnospiraceae bacterium]|nr:hypothetical protein [Cuneatibacter sp.]MDD6456938.1 hypothetical protein [Lachnospiraceae bacterium]
MEEEQKEIKRSIRLTLLWIVLILLAGVGTTYAWFTLSGRASTNVTPVGGSISKGKAALMISSNANGSFDKTCDLIFTGTTDALKPLSTADLDHFYRVQASTPEGIALLYSNADSEMDTDVLHGTVYLQCRNAACNVYFDAANLNLGSDAQALAAMRLGMRITSASGTRTWIFKLDALGATDGAESKLTVPQAGTVVSQIGGSGEASYVSDPSEEISVYLAQTAGGEEYTPGSQALVTLQADEVASVEYWLYLEGCDEQCINAAQSRPTALALAFAGVDAE